MHRLIFAMFCTIMAAAGNLYIPWIIKDMIDEVLADKNGTMLNWIAASIIAIFVVRGLFWYGQNYLMSYVGQSVIIDIRAAVFKKLQRLSVSFYDKNKTGTIMSYVTNDVNALQSAMVENTIEMITEGFILIGSVVAMIYLDWRLTLFTVCTFPVVLWFMEFFGKKLTQKQVEVLVLKGKTGSLNGFKNEDGSTFGGILRLDDSFRVVVDKK